MTTEKHKTKIVFLAFPKLFFFHLFIFGIHSLFANLNQNIILLTVREVMRQ